METKHRTYETDVLVLGSSAAGCGAAIAARRAGAAVLLVDKGKLESSGCLGGGNDHFMAVLDEVEHDGLEDLYRYYATPVSGITREQVRHFYEAMKPCLAVLEEAGVELMRTPDGGYVRSVGFGQPGPWWIHINHGFNVKPLLAASIKNRGVQVADHFMVTHLIRDGKRIAGCAGFDVLRGDFISMRCKTAVLGLGLTAQRVSNNSTHKPFNQWFSPFVTGSQIMLPLEAGASVLNLDISDMATMLPKSWGAPGMNGINNMGGRELNARGERFMGKYDPMLENGLRRNQVMGTFQEMLEGNGPPFFMDMTHFSPEDARHLQYDLMPGDKETYLEYCAARRIDFTRTPLEVEVGERMIGGIVASDATQETEVENLFNGNLIHSFSGAMCLGYAAGGFAAAKAAGVDLPPLSGEALDQCRADIYAPLKNTGRNAVVWHTFEDGVRQVMDYYVGYQRTEGSMKQALQSFQTLAAYAPRLRAGTWRELMRCRESLELFKLCRCYIMACMQRRESGRAMYRRADYPDLDPALNKCLVTRLGADGLPVFAWNS